MTELSKRIWALTIITIVLVSVIFSLVIVSAATKTTTYSTFTGTVLNISFGYDSGYNTNVINLLVREPTLSYNFTTEGQPIGNIACVQTHNMQAWTCRLEPTTQIFSCFNPTPANYLIKVGDNVTIKTPVDHSLLQGSWFQSHQCIVRDESIYVYHMGP